MKKALAQAEHAIEALHAQRQDDYYPRFHLAAPAGWINDRNGLICLNGVYHVFYQHHPYDENWGPMHWAHATNQDLVHWPRVMTMTETAVSPAVPLMITVF